MLPKPQGSFPRLPMFDSGSLSLIPPFAGCYRIVCVTWGRVYVGSTSSFSKRFLEHATLLQRRRHSNQLLQRAFDRCGPAAFRFQVLEVYHGRWRKDCLAPMEQRWMNKHNKLFNVRPAGSDEYLLVRRGVRRDLLGRPHRRPGYSKQPLSHHSPKDRGWRAEKLTLKPQAGGLPRHQDNSRNEVGSARRHPGRVPGPSKRTGQR